MNRLIVAALVFTPFAAAQVCRAEEPLVGALSLNLGSCWVRQESSEPRWKLVSFSDRVASNLGANEFQQTLNQPISTVLQGAFSSFPPSATETFYRCHAGGHFFWTSIPDGPVPLCAWSIVRRNPDNGQVALALLNVYPDHEYRGAGVPCNGAERRSLIIIINSGSDIQAVMAYLRTHKRYEGVFADLLAIGSTTIVARLEIAYDFRENVIKKLIETDELLVDDLNLVQYDGRLSISGESFRLFSGNYPGY